MIRLLGKGERVRRMRVLRSDVLRELDTSRRFVFSAEPPKGWKDGLERYARQACDALGLQRRGVHGFRATVPV